MDKILEQACSSDEIIEKYEGTVGDMENILVKEKQLELKNWLKTIGISQASFARIVFCEEHDSDDPNEIKRFSETFKKHLNRKSVPLARLVSYLEILYKRDEFIKLGYVKPEFYYDADFDESFKNNMKEISINLSKQLQKLEK